MAKNKRTFISQRLEIDGRIFRERTHILGRDASGYYRWYQIPDGDPEWYAVHDDHEMGSYDTKLEAVWYARYTFEFPDFEHDFEKITKGNEHVLVKGTESKAG